MKRKAPNTQTVHSVLHSIIDGNQNRVETLFSKYITEKTSELVAESMQSKRFNEFKSIKDVVNAVRQGKNVYWQTPSFKLRDMGDKTSPDEDEHELIVIDYKSTAQREHLLNPDGSSDYDPSEFATISNTN